MKKANKEERDYYYKTIEDARQHRGYEIKKHHWSACNVEETENTHGTLKNQIAQIVQRAGVPQLEKPTVPKQESFDMPLHRQPGVRDTDVLNAGEKARRYIDDQNKLIGEALEKKMKEAKTQADKEAAQKAIDDHEKAMREKYGDNPKTQIN